MLPKTNRLSQTSRIEEVKKTGKKIELPCFKLLILPSDSPDTKVCFVMSNGISKKAVVRNRYKRLLREVFKKNWTSVPPNIDIVVIVKRSILGKDFQSLLDEFSRVSL